MATNKSLIGGPSFWAVISIAVIDDTLDLIATLLTGTGGAIGAAGGSTIGAIAGAVGGCIVGLLGAGIGCLAVGAAGAAGGASLGAGAGAVAGQSISFVILGLSVLVSFFVAMCIAMYLFFARVKLTERKLLMTGISIIIEALPIIGGMIPATTLYLIVIRKVENKLRKKNINKRRLKKLFIAKKLTQKIQSIAK